MQHVIRRLFGYGIAGAMTLSSGLAGAEPAGFQARAGLGMADVLQPGNGDRGAEQSPSLIGDLYLGATLKRGLSLGGFFQDLAMPWGSNNMWAAGPYLDFYPKPASGLHVMGKGGIAEDTKFDFETTSTFGFSVGAGIGYDLWAERELSCGVLAEITYASLGGTAIVPAILFAIVYQ